MATGEAGDTDVGTGAGPFSLLPAVEDIAGVFDDFKAVFVSDGSYCIPIWAVAAEVWRENRFGSRADHLLDRVSVDLVGVGFDIDKDGNDAGLDHGCDVG